MYDWIIHKVLKLPLRMRVRYDHCAVSKPEITVVFLHGIAASHSTWRHMLPELTKDKDLSKVRFVTLDLIGFGKSEKPKWYKYDYSSYRKTLTKTMRKLKITSPLVICGHSMGCLIGMDYAENGDIMVDQLILISPPIIRAREAASIQDQFYGKIYNTLNQHTGDTAVGALASVIDALSSFEKKSLDTQAFRETMSKIILNKDNYAMITNLKVPMEIIHGRIDPLVIGANLRSAAKQNSHIHLTETFGGHDIVGAKAKKANKIFKDTILNWLLRVDF